MAESYEFWLICGGVELLLPVTPEGYQVEHGNRIETLHIAQVGDVYIPTTKRAKSITLEGFFPARDYPFSKKDTIGATSPMDYVEIIEGWVDSNAKVRLIIVGDHTKVNDVFYIEHIKHSEDSKSNRDVNYQISLKEYRKIQTTHTATGGDRNTTNPDNITGERVYIIKNNDYLIAISRKFYGTPDKWLDIYNANKAVIGNNPNLIFSGQRLVIPKG